jgi:hypothetical protein
MNVFLKHLSLLAVLVLVFSSCTGSGTGKINTPAVIEKEVNFSRRFNIQLKINPLKNNGLKTKANSNAANPKTIAEVKSYSAFLTTNDADPFASGANPNGDGFLRKVDAGNVSGPVIIKFPNVPPSTLPYFAVIAAFDDTVGNGSGNNITKINTAIVPPNNNWAMSQNSVTVLPSGSLKFSDGNNQLNCDLALLDGAPNRIEFTVNISDGTPAYVPGITGIGQSQ